MESLLNEMSSATGEMESLLNDMSSGNLPTTTDDMESLLNDMSSGNVPTTDDVNALIDSVSGMTGMDADLFNIDEVMNPNCLNYSYEPFVF